MRGHTLSQDLENEGYPDNVVKPFIDFQTFNSRTPEIFIDDAVNYYVEQPVHAHCSSSPWDPDCAIKPGDFDTIRKGVRTRIAWCPKLNQDQFTDTWGHWLPGGIPNCGIGFITRLGLSSEAATDKACNKQ